MKLEVLDPVTRANYRHDPELKAELERDAFEALMRDNGTPHVRQIRGYGSGLPMRPLSPARLA